VPCASEGIELLERSPEPGFRRVLHLTERFFREFQSITRAGK
jgi:hypothetical protein